MRRILPLLLAFLIPADITVNTSDGKVVVTLTTTGKVRISQDAKSVLLSWEEAPGPLPPPLPIPEPPGYAGPLLAVMILPLTPTPEQSAVRVDGVLKQAFADHKAAFQSYLNNEVELTKGDWPKVIAALKPADYPAVFWVDPTGKSYGTTTAATREDIIHKLKLIRGKR